MGAGPRSALGLQGLNPDNDSNVVNDCPLCAVPGGLARLHNRMVEAALRWIGELRLAL